MSYLDVAFYQRTYDGVTDVYTDKTRVEAISCSEFVDLYFVKTLGDEIKSKLIKEIGNLNMYLCPATDTITINLQKFYGSSDTRQLFTTEVVALDNATED